MNAEGVKNHIVKWLNDYARKSGMKGFVVGVSGGIDSAVSSTLAAYTGMPVICLELPIHQAEDQVSRARRHIEHLKEQYSNVQSAKVDLTDVYEDFKKSLPELPGVENRDMAYANSRARLRMTTLYYYAAAHRYLVCGTGNKVEDFGVGFYTKYGDGGVDLSPIADLMKTEVFELGKHLGVIQEILDAPPTDGLWSDNRSDVDQIGATYPELEWAMRQHEKGASADEFQGREKEVFEIYKQYHNANRHKMDPIPVCEVPDELKG